jgi:hypothetical protein
VRVGADEDMSEMRDESAYAALRFNDNDDK